MPEPNNGTNVSLYSSMDDREKAKAGLKRKSGKNGRRGAVEEDGMRVGEAKDGILGALHLSDN